MKYIIGIVVIIITYVTTSRVKKNCRKALEQEIIDWGLYKHNPLTGKKAVRVAKIGIFWANCFFWGIVLVIAIDAMLSLLSFWV